MLKIGGVVHSVAGHDKNRFYLVVEMRENRVCIADGKLRKLASPKWKNPKHLRGTGYELDLAEVATDKKLRLALAPFQNKGGVGQTEKRED